MLQLQSLTGDGDYPGTSIPDWHVWDSAAFIKNERKRGTSDADITRYMRAQTKPGSSPCPWGCTEEKIAAAFRHANDPAWASLPVENGLVDWHIEDAKATIENRTREGKSVRQIIDELRTNAQACGSWGCDDMEIAEAFRQIERGYRSGTSPPGTYDAQGKTTRAAGTASPTTTTSQRRSFAPWAIGGLIAASAIAGILFFAHRR